MSRGDGQIQRRVLEILQGSDRALPTKLLAAMVYMNGAELAEFRKFDLEIQLMTLGMAPVSNSQRNAVSRAYNKLWRQNRIQAFDLHNPLGCY
jgi:hypothetical protein